ncbi:Gfo/Idh/MocA family protein [Halopelagius fulvigenes]|uniref:Gfo/Idh/MocA family protein n=1 Tax=Halopelagius fulvigenes TaxID=1198324 RepID=A0ABD5TV32_9EURY
MAVRTAVIGSGIVSTNNHLPALARNPRTDLLAVADVDEESVREAAAEYGCRAYTDAETMLEREDAEWVHVATPVQTHADLARAAIDAGANVTVQKPAATNPEELGEMRSAADEAGVSLSVVHNWLYYPVVRELRRRIASGEIGEVRAVRTAFTGEGRPDETYRGDWVLELEGGDLEEGMSHPFYLTLALGGVPRSEDDVTALTRATEEFDHGVTYDGAQVQYVAENDALCSITYLSSSARDSKLAVHGTEGSIHVDIPTATLDVHDAESGPYHFPNERFSRNAERTRQTAEGAVRNAKRYVAGRIEDELDRHDEDSPDGHYFLFDEAAKALERGEKPPVTPELSRWVLELTEQVRESARE